MKHKINKLVGSLLMIILTLSVTSLKAQTGCFEIKSILVDACGIPEAENEMVFFQVGPNPLNVSNLVVDWPNNSYLGICQNAQTASTVLTLNSSIVSCGLIQEPIGGILPAGSKVLLATSTNLNPTFNSFSNLTDSIYIIFQCFGNSNSGHFKNYQSGSGPRTLVMNFGSTCADTVTYIVDSLVTQAGIYGQQDGATVLFDPAGNATYTNPGCQAPINNIVSVIAASDSSVCPGDIITVNANIISGNYTGFFWAGGNGNFGTPLTLSSTYQTNNTFTGIDNLVFGIVTNCNDTIFDSLSVNINGGSNLVLTASGPTSFCNGDSVILSASGAAPYLWSTGDTTSSITVLTSGNYIVTGTSSCGTVTASQTVIVNFPAVTTISASGPTTFCIGDSVVLTASGASSYLWSNGATTPSITVFNTATFTVTGTNQCGSSSSNQLVSTTSLPVANITASGPLVFCQGDSVTLTSDLGNSYLWSTGQTTQSITVFSTNSFTVTVTNICGSSSTSISTNVNAQPSGTLTVNGNTSLCAGDSSILTITSGLGNYLWSTGATTTAITVLNPGTYAVTVSNNCGVFTASQTFTAGALPVISISGNNGVLCPGDNDTLIATGGNSYLWSNGATTSQIIVNTTGNYVVTATNGCGSTLDSVNVVVSNITSLFTPSITSGQSPLVVDFQNNSVGGISYNWNFDDNGAFSIDTNANYTFVNERTYNVVLTVTDANGCTAIYSDSIEVTNQELYIPNVFSPNGDNINEEFNIKGKGITSIQGSIINRWGKEITTWNSLTKGWNGTSSGGEKLPDGVYFFIVNLRFDNGEVKNLKGNVTLIR